MRLLGQLKAFYFFYKEILHAKKNTNKKYTSRYVLKILKKRVFYLLVCFFLKHLREKGQRTKISGRKLLITSWAVFFVHLFYAYRKYLEQKLFVTLGATIFMHLF